MDAPIDDPVLRDMERRGVDWRQLLSRLRMTPDERLRHLEEFMDDMRALRQDVARSRGEELEDLKALQQHEQP